MSIELICVKCKERFFYNGWSRTVHCPNCGSSSTVSTCTYDRRVGFEAELKELRKKWNYYLATDK